MSAVQEITEYQGEREKKEQWELNYDLLLVSSPCLTLASACVSAIVPC